MFTINPFGQEHTFFKAIEELKEIAMKTVRYIFILIAIALIILNATKLDLSAPFTGDSAIAVISILAAICVILLMLILHISHSISKKKK